MPPGRKPVITKVRGEDARNKIYHFLDKNIRQGHRLTSSIRWSKNRRNSICSTPRRWPSILQTAVFPNFRVGLIHGRMKQEEKDAVMDEFRSGAIHILVATTVIEVGVDVPNASVMIIEHAERFGLSQLHQLRGRVGRGDEQAIASCLRATSARRKRASGLAIMEETSDGFKVAEKDLEIRGPGEVMGTRQSGVPAFRVGNIVRDYALLEAAKREADYMLTTRRNSRETARLVEIVRSQPKFGLAAVG